VFYFTLVEDAKQSGDAPWEIWIMSHFVRDSCWSGRDGNMNFWLLRRKCFCNCVTGATVNNLGCSILTAIDAINVLSMSCDQDCFHWKGIAGNVLANLRNITTNIVGDAVKNVFLFVIEAYSFKTVQFCFFSLFCFMCSRGKLQTPNINSSCLCQPACPTVRKNSTTAGKFSWNMMLRSFTKICTEDSFWLKSDRNNRHSTRDQRTFINTVLTNVTMVVIVTKVSSVSVVTLPLLLMLPLILSLPWLSVLSDCCGYASAPNVVQSSDVSCVIFIFSPKNW